jgi:hypothetical protein
MQETCLMQLLVAVESVRTLLKIMIYEIFKLRKGKLNKEK